MALRSGRRAIRRRAAGGVPNTSGRARARRRAERHSHADAAVEQQDFPWHHARLVGLRAGSVQRGKPGGGYGVPGWRRGTAIRRPGVRQPDREGKTFPSPSGSSSSPAASRRPATIEVSNTTRSPISTRAFCSKRSSPKSKRPSGCVAMPRAARLPARAAARLPRSPSRGNGPVSSARCSPGSAASRTSSRARRSEKGGTTTRR